MEPMRSTRVSRSGGYQRKGEGSLLPRASAWCGCSQPVNDMTWKEELERNLDFHQDRVNTAKKRIRIAERDLEELNGCLASDIDDLRKAEKALSEYDGEE